MTTPLDETASKLMSDAMGIYKTRSARAALRCALIDAAGLCDFISRVIEAENKGHNGKGPTTKRGRDLAKIATRCGDALMEMRTLVHFDDVVSE
jgi:hypothetical protein